MITGSAPYIDTLVCWDRVLYACQMLFALFIRLCSVCSYCIQLKCPEHWPYIVLCICQLEKPALGTSAGDRIPILTGKSFIL